MIKRSPFLVILVLILAVLFIPAKIFALEPSSKRVEINLAEQKLKAYESDQLVYNFTVSTGKPWWPTPTGTFYPYTKLRFTRMVGGSRESGTYYNLPQVPYVVYFYKSYALHGTYWHNNFGQPMSHGCVNLKTLDMEKLYYWLDMNTPITIYGNLKSG